MCFPLKSGNKKAEYHLRIMQFRYFIFYGLLIRILRVYS